MARHTAFRRACLLTLALLAAAWWQPASGSPARSAQTAQAAGRTRTGEPASAAAPQRSALGQDAHSAGPSSVPFDIRPLLDLKRAGRPLPSYSPLAIQQQLAQGQKSAPQAKKAPAGAAPTKQAAGKIQPGGASVPGGKPAAQPAPSAAQCSQRLVNTTMSNNAAGWTAFDPNVYFTAGPDQAIYMDDGADNGDATPYTDAAGQIIDISASTLGFTPTGLIVQLYVGYDPATVDSYDDAYINFYTSDGSSLGSLEYYQVLPEFSDNGFHYVQYYVSDPTIIGDLLAANRVGFTVDTVTDDAAPAERVFFDDVQVYACNSEALGTISGDWDGSSDLTGATTVLSYVSPEGVQTDVDVTFADLNGGYTFSNVPALLGNGDYYQVWYINDGYADDLVSFWAREKIPSFTIGENFALPNTLNLLNTSPDVPGHGADVTLPFTFTWRGFTNDYYYFCIYDIQDTDKSTCSALFPFSADPGNPLLNDFTVTESFLKSDPALGFQYGKTYAWYLYIALGPNGATPPTEPVVERYGSSFDSNYVTFVQQAASVPAPAPPDQNPLPSSSTSTSWTVMVYLAGDNDLGDPLADYDPSSKLTGHLEQLKQIAPRFPNIHLVVQSDFYDGSGTQFCYLPASGGQQCKQLGEQDTADPATLATFVQTAKAQFPASRSMLIISDHGHAVYGVGIDDTNHPPSAGASSVVAITPDKLAIALASAGLGPQNQLDVIFFDTCLMGGIEAAATVSPYARTMVSGTDTMWMLPIYDRVLDLVTATPNAPRQIAIGIVNAYAQVVTQRLPRVYSSAAAYDLTKASGVMTKVNALGTALTAVLGANGRSAIDAVRLSQVQVYDSSADFLHERDSDAFVDLRHLATLIAGSAAPALQSAKPAANDLLTELGPVGTGGLVIASQQNTGDNGDGRGVSLDFGSASGLFVFFPSGSNDGDQATMRAMYLGTTSTSSIYAFFINRQNGWGQFIQAYAAPGTSAARGPGRPARGGRPSARPFTTDLTRRAAFLPIIVR